MNKLIIVLFAGNTTFLEVSQDIFTISHSYWALEEISFLRNNLS